MPGMLESCAEPQQRLTQLLEHLPVTVEKGEETSIWPPPVLAVNTHHLHRRLFQEMNLLFSHGSSSLVTPGMQTVSVC